MPHLIVLTGVKKGQRIPLVGNRIMLGRESVCNVLIDEEMLPPGKDPLDKISREHAIIHFCDGKYILEDGDGKKKPSRNGTFVNDEKLPRQGRKQIYNNDIIRLCIFGCHFQADEDTAFSQVAAINHESSSVYLLAQPSDQLRHILEISNSLSRTLDVDSLLPRIVDQLFLLFKQANRGFVVIRDDVSRSLTASVAKARPVGANHDLRFSVSIVERCMEGMKAILGNDLPIQFPGIDSIVALPVRSLMCAPLWGQDGKAFGAIQLDTLDSRKKFTEDDLNLLMGVASQASIALSNARLHRDSLANQRRAKDLEFAREVQRALLPQGMPKIPGYEFYAFYDPAHEVGGDLYHFIPLPGGRLAILLGDVAGKGVAAALIMVKFSAEAKNCLLSESDLSAAIGKLDSLMRDSGLSGRFVTLVAAVLDPASHTLTLLNAGHPNALLTRQADHTTHEVPPDDIAGPPIGILDDQVWGSYQISLQPGDRLLMYSDGISEATDPFDQLFGTASVRAVVSSGPVSPNDCGATLIEAVRRHTAGAASHPDDMTLVCLRRSS